MPTITPILKIKSSLPVQVQLICLKKNSAILNSGVRINQSGIQTAQELFALASRREDHQIGNLVGVQKRRLFIRFFGQKTLLNSDF
ncbi:hypothetical protein [Nostoc sp.]|uniref:hypothetical protein n=1 Tax=Nostoc sp. TaxID=1180 RepID=UPI002FFCC56D